MEVWPVAIGLMLSLQANTRQERKANFSAPDEISLHNSKARQTANSNA